MGGFIIGMQLVLSDKNQDIIGQMISEVFKSSPMSTLFQKSTTGWPLN